MAGQFTSKVYTWVCQRDWSIFRLLMVQKISNNGHMIWLILICDGQWASPFENLCRSIFYCNRWAKTPTIQKSKLQWCIPKLLKMETNEMNLIGKLMNLQQFKMNRAYLFQRITFQKSLCKWRTPKSTIRKKISMW